MYFAVMPWLNHIVIIVDMYWIFICQLLACNLFTQHVSYLIGETPLVNCGPRSILLHLNTFYCFYCSLQTNTIFHSIRLILCFQQAGEIDNLTVTLGQSTLIVLCRFHVGAGIPGVAPHYTPPPSTFNVLLDSYWFDNLGFLLREKLAAVRIIPSSWGSQRTCALPSQGAASHASRYWAKKASPLLTYKEN